MGNRVLHKRQAEAIKLVNEGASPQQVDKVLFDLGFPMEPFAMSDLAGMDVGYRIREELRKDPANAPARNWTDELVEAGRLGQKTQAGVFDYKEGDRTLSLHRMSTALLNNTGVITATYCHQRSGNP